MTGARRAGIAGVLGSVTSVQVGAAAATTLFAAVGPLGAVSLRLASAAVVLGVSQRPTLRRPRSELATFAMFGLVTAGMNLSIYEAFSRLPLGPAITVELLGPLALSLALSRRVLDAAWALIAGAGVALLGGGSVHLPLAGVGFALVAAVGWAGYILLNQRVGRTPGGDGLALAQATGALVVAPVGFALAGGAMIRPGVLAVGCAVGILSSVIPYSFDLFSLRRLPPATFGVLMSLNPAVAALAGWVLLSQRLSGSEWLAIGLVVAASAGAAGTHAKASVQSPLASGD